MAPPHPPPLPSLPLPCPFLSGHVKVGGHDDRARRPPGVGAPVAVGQVEGEGGCEGERAGWMGLGGSGRRRRRQQRGGAPSREGAAEGVPGGVSRLPLHGSDAPPPCSVQEADHRAGEEGEEAAHWKSEKQIFNTAPGKKCETRASTGQAIAFALLLNRSQIQVAVG